MPPKVKITKEMVADASFEVIRAQGHENLNARTIAVYLGCSTQPVLYSFRTVDEIREAAYDEFDFVNEKNVHGEYEDMYSAAFTFRADVEKTDASYLINNVRISVGAEVHFRTPYFVGFGYVTDVTEIPAE